jgi:hypothetical protein
MVGLRISIMIVFLITVLVDDVRDLMSWVALVLAVGLVAVIIQTNDAQTQRLRNQSILDLGTLIVLVPVVVLNGFVSAEPGQLLPAEQSALLQTGGGLLIVVALLIWLGVSLFPEDRSLVPAELLPGLIAILAINFVLHDYRNQTVLAMLAVSYFIGAAAMVLGHFVAEPVRRHVPATFYIATILAGMVLFDPGLANIFERDGLVQMFAGMMILIGLAALVIIPNPSLDQIRLGAGGRGQRRQRARQYNEPHERETNDFRGEVAERGR